jgi:hypothetical protein
MKRTDQFEAAAFFLVYVKASVRLEDLPVSPIGKRLLVAVIGLGLPKGKTLRRTPCGRRCGLQ